MGSSRLSVARLVALVGLAVQIPLIAAGLPFFLNEFTKPGVMAGIITVR